MYRLQIRSSSLAQGSCFVEFAYEAEMKKFLERKDIPKYTSDGPDMLVMTK